MAITSDYEDKTFTRVVIKFCFQFFLFVVGVLVASSIIYGVEKTYTNNDFHYPPEHHHTNETFDVMPEDEIAYLKNHSSFNSFTADNHIAVKKVIEFLKNITVALNDHYEIKEREFTGDGHYDEYHGDSQHDEYHGDSQHDEYHGDDQHYWDNEDEGSDVLGDEDFYNVGDHGMTFLEAFVLTLSIVSTIGWGHVTPITSGGKAVSVIVALLGIPLSLLMIISGCHVVMRSVKWLLKRFMRRVTTLNEDRIKENTHLAYKPILVFLFVSYIFITAAIIAKLEMFSYTDALWYVFMAITTVGFGDVVQEGVFHYDQLPKKTEFAVFMLFWIVFGFISLGSVVLSFLYDFNMDDRHQNHFYKKNEPELVDDTDDFDGNTYTGGDNIYTGGDIES